MLSFLSLFCYIPPHFIYVIQVSMLVLRVFLSQIQIHAFEVFLQSTGHLSKLRLPLGCFSNHPSLKPIVTNILFPVIHVLFLEVS